MRKTRLESGKEGKNKRQADKERERDETNVREENIGSENEANNSRKQTGKDANLD